MKTIIFLASAYVNRHWHVSVCIFLLLLFQYLRIDQQADLGYGFFIFFATLSAYNLHDLTFRNYFLPRFRKISLPLSTGIAGSVISALFIDTTYLVYIIPVIIFTLAYILPVLPGRKKLRDIPFVKVFVLVFVVVYTVIIIPGVLAKVHPTVLLYHSAAGSMLVFLVALLFDIRDINVDRINGPKSLPLFFGVSKIQKMAYFFSLIGITAEFLMANQFLIDLPEFISMTTTYVLIVFLYFKISGKTQSFAYSFYADGLLALPYLIYTLITL